MSGQNKEVISLSKTTELVMKTGDIVLIDSEDFPRIRNYNWRIHSNGYVIAGVEGRRILLHRFLLKNPKGFVIDHISGDILDNRKSNLRICTRQENLLNSKAHKGSRSIYKGVVWDKQTKKWRARITVNYKKYCLGYFENETDAAKAYNKAAIKYFGEFARSNKVN